MAHSPVRCASWWYYAKARKSNWFLWRIDVHLFAGGLTHG